MDKKILVAAAWPYANGSLHLGHVASLIGSDILARYFRLRGDQVLFVSGSDCHGTPIALEADRQRVDPAIIANRYHQEFLNTLIGGLNFSYDLYTQTTTAIHSQTVQEIFLKLYQKGYIYTKTENLPFCKDCNRFLPDRYIEGECPHCHFASARGDQCDNCGSLLDSNQLINSKCKICGGSPVWQPTEHFFLKLSAFQDQLSSWVKDSKGWRANALNFTKQLLVQGLHDRAITRDTLWGVPIPLEGYETKRIYVWFEAVCGYFSASKEWAQKIGQPEAWRDFWQNPEALHYYVHGKDNIPFHTTIWPAILLGYGGLHLPDRIISSEYLAVEGKQFSKSRNWAIWLPQFLAKFNSETLRYYLVANGSELADADFSWNEFQVKTNSELIGNFGNYIHRVLSFVQKNFPEGLVVPQTVDSEAKEFWALTQEAFSAVGEAIEQGRFRDGLKKAFKFVEYGNRFFNDIAPWSLVKQDRDKTERLLAVAVQAIKSLSVLVYPFLPKSAEEIGKQVGFDVRQAKWEFPLADRIDIHHPKPLYKRVEDADVSEQKALLGKE